LRSSGRAAWVETRIGGDVSRGRFRAVLTTEVFQSITAAEILRNFSRLWKASM
jgi:hypothetical protein